MSIYLRGVTFKDMFVRPPDDAAIFARVLSDGIVDGCAMSAAGSTLHLTAGRLIACGREGGIASALDIPIAGASSGYARLVLSVDMSASASASDFKQVRLDVEYSATLGGFEDLTQDDINNGGTLYQMVLCVMSLGAAGITGILSTCGTAHGKGAGTAVTLAAANWNTVTKLQTVRVDGATADGNVVVTYAHASKAAYVGADIDCIAQADGELTFTCVSVPSVDVTVNVLLL